ncbi:MAG TPA: alpha-L-Rha alpha-1,3-L-rhamnosyltransferase [Ruminococcaceae bacterium]|nr:alpha-L-Rha alpha-1,3-L-rhamnosyltransferase [Oscillospiraceae bacterium]HCT17052.1 alpha-L-Rha alpha-1,3-L-rhamnosyltransferase [Oscillospiraceae bacterium]
MISVVLAAYKGEKYIRAQAESILRQIGDADELIISDDFPEGKTREAIIDIIESDKRVKYIVGPGVGVIRNFEYAISQSKGDYIFLSDQDDVWLDGKVERVVHKLKNGADLVLHNAIITDGDLNETGETAFGINKTKKGFLRNILKNSYQGCCMAFGSELKKYILPFPENLPMHDQWIGLMAEKHGRVAFIDEPLILYRRHGSNVTGNGSSLKDKLKWRADILKAVLGR